MYCKTGEESDVTAYFHVMGHLVCETCDKQFRSKGGLQIHLQEHLDKGDRVPQSTLDLLQCEMEAVWEQAGQEGRNSIRRAKSLNLIARALMVIINP